jgi:hypothetical protein
MASLVPGARFLFDTEKRRSNGMGRTMIVLLALAIGLAVPGFAAAGSDTAAVLREDDDGVVLLTDDDDDGDGTTTGDTGNTNSGDSLDTTADRSRSRDRSGDNTGEPNRRDRSNSRDRSADNTADHSVGVTTNT